jgi:hypothetical protein
MKVYVPSNGDFYCHIMEWEFESMCCIFYCEMLTRRPSVECRIVECIGVKIPL